MAFAVADIFYNIKGVCSMIEMLLGGFPGLYTPHHRKAFEADLEEGIRIIK